LLLKRPLAYRRPNKRSWSLASWLAAVAEIRAHRHAGCCVRPAGFAWNFAKSRVEHGAQPSHIASAYGVKVPPQASLSQR
jgi:hypothetical protein